MSSNLAESRTREPAATAERAHTERAHSLPVFLPPTDIWEAEDRLVIQAEIPGVEAAGVEVSVERNVLRLQGRTRMTPPSGYSLIHAEYRDGDYERSFTLPAEIDVGRIEATTRHGLLTLVLPKVAPPPAHKIAVKAE